MFLRKRGEDNALRVTVNIHLLKTRSEQMRSRKSTPTDEILLSILCRAKKDTLVGSASVRQ